MPEQKQADKTHIRCKVIIEVLGKPKEHVEKSLKGYVDKIKTDSELIVMNTEFADAEEKEYALQVRLGITGRTGNELNQETLTIDGKQFRRISEGVEKQPKPKYEFSEFYQRFKR